jgi:hypothetical protein
VDVGRVKTQFDAPFADLTRFDASQTWYRVEQLNGGQARKRRLANQVNGSVSFLIDSGIWDETADESKNDHHIQNCSVIISCSNV